MSAPGITYSGVLAKKAANKNADENLDESVDAGVFGGLKFWVSARVSNRKSCADTIQGNGGTIVLKEGDADMLICDPAKGPIPGSYSYKVIADAVKEGSLDTKEDYLCSSLVANPGPSKPKLTRNKFTEEDDKILIKFVTERERLGEPISGNDIYKELAEDHPHHTWQSWRDRWVKKLRSIPRPPASNIEQPPQPKNTSASRQARQEVTASKSPVARSRVQFTIEEDDILLEAIHHSIDNNEAWNGYVPYKRLASEFPQRTYLSWRERALNHVAKQNKDQISQWELEAGFRQNDDDDPPVDNLKDQRNQKGQDRAGANSPVAPQGSKNGMIPASNRLHKKDNTHGSTEENDDKLAPEVTVLSPTRRTRSVESSPKVPLPARGSASDHSPPSSIPNTPRAQDLGAPVTTKEQFYRDYNIFLESVGITSRRIPSVGGRAIALWDLWQSVRSKKVEIVELDWQQIAEDLGFDWVSMESVPNDLHQCYEEHLAPFADAMMNFNDSSDENDSSDDDTNAETERPLPSSPPVLPSLKRLFDTTNAAYKYPSLESSPKRRRLDRGREIPSTPEHGNGRSHLRSLNAPNKTPKSSPLSNYGTVERASRNRVRSSDGNRKDQKIKEGIAQPQGRKRRFEPETQDFNFAPDTHVDAHDEPLGHSDSISQRTNTPSQQLLLESDSVSPTIQHNISTPTPRRSSRVPLQLDGSGENGIHQGSKGTRNALTLPSTQKPQRQGRALPSSWVSKSPIAADSTVLQDIQPSSATVPETEPRKRPTPPKETPDDIIDHFVSLGYSRDTVLRSLKATSWVIGNAGQVMEMLKQGDPLPQRTTGVWTVRDDDSLALVYSKEPPSDVKAEKKRAKEMKRLQAKHGEEQIALRKRYLLDELPG
ncbi:TRF2-interacting telomeric protein/Rap1 C terminal domain-containing protein [Hypoxylon argillaceum]|nr:TRF2-interacting telomeric protein/Rap1 C terminal domain-containing protein [Hypoxylon argillaceum]